MSVSVVSRKAKVDYDNTIQTYVVTLDVAGEFQYTTPTTTGWRTGKAETAECTVQYLFPGEAWVSFIQIRGDHDAYLNLDTHEAIYYNDEYRALAILAVDAFAESTGYRPRHRMD